MALPLLGTLFVNLVISLAFKGVAAHLTPKEKKDPPASVKQLPTPQAKVGLPIVVVMGTCRLTGGNVLFEGDNSIRRVRTPSTDKKG